MRDRLKQFVHNLFLGTKNRVIATILGAGTLLVVSAYAGAFYLAVHLLGMGNREAWIFVGDLSYALLAAIWLYIIIRTIVRAWRESREET